MLYAFEQIYSAVIAEIRARLSRPYVQCDQPRVERAEKDAACASASVGFACNAIRSRSANVKTGSHATVCALPPAGAL
jgi:hypothetical protein